MGAFLGRIVDRLRAENLAELRHRLLILRAVDQDPRRRDAALPRIHQHAAGAARQRRVERRAGQDDVRRFAAELLMDALDRVGGVLGDEDAGAGRAGEADHVDVGMRGERGADAGAVALDEVEHARRRAGRVHHLGEDRGRAGGLLAGLEDHGIAGGDRRGDLGGDLVHRPVPRRDQSDDADRLRRRPCSGRSTPRIRSPSAPRASTSDGPGPSPTGGSATSDIGAPISSEIALAMSGMRFLYSSTIRPSSARRSSREVCEKLSNARRAAVTALSTSPAVPSTTVETDLLGRRVDHLVARAAVAVGPAAVDIMLVIAAHGEVPSCDGVSPRPWERWTPESRGRNWSAWTANGI